MSGRRILIHMLLRIGLLSELTVIGLLISCMQLSTPVIEPLCLLLGMNGWGL